MRKLLLVIAALVIVPIAEIAVLIAVGKVIGLGWTLLLVLATSALGGWMLRREGARAWQAVQEDIAANRPPGNSAVDGLLVVIGGVFMLVPGFVSDVIGLFFIAPPTRVLARTFVLSILTGRMSPTVANALFGARRVRASAGPATASTSTSQPGDFGPPIEGEIIDPRPSR